MKCLIVKVGSQKYAISIADVIHIVETVKLEVIPNESSYVLGALNFHGELIIAIDLVDLLKLRKEEYNPMKSAMAICQLDKTKFALIFDEVLSVEEIEGDITSIKGDQVLTLDLNKVIDQEVLHV